MKPTAWCDIKETPNYRADAFVAGLKACGFHVRHRELPGRAPPGPGDVLVIWNRYSDREQTADAWEKAGGTVLVAENGYVGRDAQGRQYYAIARHGHNGSGEWFPRGPERWAALGIEEKRWRMSGDHILVAPNRYFGPRGFVMPQEWDKRTVQALRRYTKRPIRVRQHPGTSKPERPLEEDLANCWAVVIWASSVGVHALLAGIPVICCAPWWILKSAAPARIEDVDLTVVGERRPALERLAWAQWTVEEIARGDPFHHLLSPTGQGEVAAPA